MIKKYILGLDVGGTKCAVTLGEHTDKAAGIGADRNLCGKQTGEACADFCKMLFGV